MNKIFNTPIVVFTLFLLFYSLTIPSFALTYINANPAVSIEFTVPDGWERQSLPDDADPLGDSALLEDTDLLKERYGYAGGTGEFILFGFCDLASIGSMTNGQDAPDHYINSRAYIAAIAGVDADRIKVVNYHGIDYYQFKTDSSSGQSGSCTAPEQSSACTVIKLFCVINTTLFTFQYGSAKESPHFSDFEEILNGVVYTIPGDSNNLEIYQLDREDLNDQSKAPFFNITMAIMLYSLPIFIYRHYKIKANGLH